MIIKRSFPYLIAVCLLLVGVLMAADQTRAQSGVAMVIYDDALQNGWQDWSWPGGASATPTITDLNATTPANNGTAVMMATYGSNWSGVRFHSNVVQMTADYTDLQFWFYSTTAEEVDAALQDGTGTTVGAKVRVTPAAVNTWQLVTIPMSDFGTADFENIVIQARGAGAGTTIYVDDVVLLGTLPTPTPTIVFTPAPTPVPGAPGNPFYETYTEKSAPAVVIGGSALPTANGGTAVNITIDPATPIEYIYPTQFGNNAGVWMGDNALLSQEAFDRLSAIDIPFIRFPGGSTSDIYAWNASYNDDAGQPIGHPQYIIDLGNDNFNNGWAVDTYEFLDWAERLGTLPLITVNHGLAVEEDTATAAALAADWVEYANAPNDGSNPNGGINWAARRAADGHPAPFDVQYWTVGNEVFGPWEVGYLPDGADYAANFNVIYDAMKAVDPDIYIGIVGGFETHASWFVQVLQAPGAADRMDFIDVHNYYHYASAGSLPLVNEISAEGILDLVDIIGQNRAELDSMIAAHTTHAPGAIPYYYGEFNGTNGVNYHHVQLVNALFYAEALGEMIINQFVGVAKWDIYNGWAANTEGDMGMLARNHPTVPDHTPYPSYYPYYFYQVNFGDRLLASSSSDDDVKVYASQFTADGNVGLIIVNETAAKTATLDLGAFTAGDVNGWSLTGGDLDQFAVTLNGVANGYTHGGPLLEDVTPYHTDANASNTLTVALDPFSVTSLVLYADTAVTPTPTATATNTPVVATDTPTATATNTPIAPTDTPTPTATNTPIAPTDTPTPTTAAPLAVGQNSVGVQSFSMVWIALAAVAGLIITGALIKRH